MIRNPGVFSAHSDRSSSPVMSATQVSFSRVPSWSIPFCHNAFGALSMASISRSVHAHPTENSQARPFTPPPAAMCSRSLWENPAPSRRTSTLRRKLPGIAAIAALRAARLSPASFEVALPGRGSITRTSSTLSQTARFGTNPTPPL